MDKDRRLAFLILKEIEEKKTWSNLAVNSVLSKENADNVSFIRELVYGTLRNKILLDFNIDRFLKKPKLGISERIWLRMGFYQMAFMNSVADHGAINETVALAKKFKKGSEGFINAVLRSFQRDGKEIRYPDEKNAVKYLSVKYSAHEELVSLWLESYGKEKCEELLNASNKPAPLVLRVNILKISRDDLIDKLKELGFTAEKGNLSNTSVIAKGSGILDTKLFKEGFFAVQGESSQYAIEKLNPLKGKVLIDLCSAPGGKSCCSAEHMENEGSILSFDYYEHRVELIKKEYQRLGINIIKANVSDATVLNEELIGKADYVICDVPCSGLGTLRENPEIKFRAPDKIDVQKKILENGLKYLKDDGRLLYSTCTINPLENEEITKVYQDEYILDGEQIFTTENGPDGFYICIFTRRS